MAREKEGINSIYIPRQCREAMRVILERPVTIVQAPMGYGKTVAVREFLQKEEVTIIWLDLKHCVNDKWWEYFCSSVRDNFPHQQDLCDEMERQGCPGGGQIINRIIDLINRFEPRHPIVYVIDNLHLVFNPFVPRLIELSAEKDDSNTHVVLLSRNTYSGLFYELMLKGKLAILDKELFLFQEQDIVNYYRLNNRRLTADAASGLMNLTEGWVSALYLLLPKVENKDTPVIPASVYEIIDFGWFSRLTEIEAEFLYHAALPGDFTFEQARFIFDGLNEVSEEEVHDILSGLTRENAFLIYDPEHDMYHIHQLVRQFLCRKVERLPQIKRKQIYHTWGDWYYEQNDYYQAMEYYMDCGDFAAVLESFSDVTRHRLSVGNWPRYRKLIEICPESALRSYPEIAAVLGLFSYLTGDFNSYYKMKEFICRILNDPGTSEAERAVLESNLTVVRILEVYNDIGQMMEHLAEIKEPNSCLRAFLYTIGETWTLGCFSPLFLFWNKTGGLQENIREAGALFDRFQQYVPGCGAGCRQIMEAEWSLQRGDLIEAETLSHEGELMALRERKSGNVISARIIQLQIAVLTGNEKKEAQIKEEIRSMIDLPRKDSALLRTMMELYLSSEAISRKNSREVASWLVTENEFRHSVYFSSYPLCQILYGKYMLLKKEYTRIIGYFQMMVQEEFYSRHMMFLVYAQIFLAISHYQTGRSDKAGMFLAGALDLAAGDQVYLPFAEYFEQLKPMRIMLKDQPHYQSVIDNIETQIGGIKTYLTKREKELARLAAAGKTNREIGEELFIAASTVKRSMVVIFKKLNISRRHELVQYRDLFE